MKVPKMVKRRIPKKKPISKPFMTNPPALFNASSNWTGSGGVYRKTLSDGSSDAQQILESIEELSQKYSIMPSVRAFALSLMPKTMVNDDQLAQLNAISRFVTDDMLYVRDPVGVEYFISVPKMLEEYANTGKIFGDCDDHVLMFNTLMKAVGFNVRAVAINIGNTDYHDHVFSEFEMNGQTHDFDGCKKTNPFERKIGDRLAVVPLVP